MYTVTQAEINDVDLLLDMKLDIIFNSEEVLTMEKNEMEKVVNYTEEEIREKLSNYKFIYKEHELVASFSTDDYDDGKIIDMIYVLPNYRKNKIATWIIDYIIENNFEPLYMWVYKNNDIAVSIANKKGFNIVESAEYKLLMKSDNLKKENNCIKLKIFEQEVEKLAKKYGVEYSLQCK